MSTRTPCPSTQRWYYRAGRSNKMSTRPPRPSAQHWYCRETERWWHPDELEALREDMLKDDPDFTDLERVGHTDLRGPRASVSLQAVLNELGIRTAIGFDGTIDAKNPLVKYEDSYVARYFHHAGILASQAVREGCDDGTAFIYQSHAEGVPQRTIAAELGEALDIHWTRKRVRTVVEAFSARVKAALDQEGEAGYL